jgi:hypothetical protein
MPHRIHKTWAQATVKRRERLVEILCNEQTAAVTVERLAALA